MVTGTEHSKGEHQIRAVVVKPQSITYYQMLLVFYKFLMILNISEMAARRAAGLVIFRCKEGEIAGQAEWLLMQTSYGKHHW